MCVLSHHTTKSFFREREKERIFPETLNVHQAKKKGKKRGEKKRGFLGPRQKRETLSFCESRVVSLTKEEEGRERARTHTHTQRECVCE